MFSHIKTSKANKEVVTQLTNKLNLGAENVIARIALAYSLAQNKKFSIDELEDSGGKEYSKSVLLGDNLDIYMGIVCSKYGIYKQDKEIAKFVKIHLDKGLIEILAKWESQNIEGIEFIDKLISCE